MIKNVSVKTKSMVKQDDKSERVCVTWHTPESTLG